MRTTRWPNRKKFPIPARRKPCRSWTWTATEKATCCSWILTARRRCVSGCKIAAASSGRKFISRCRPSARSIADNLGGDAKNYVVTIAQNSGRAEVSQFTRQPSEVLSGAFHRGQFQILPLAKTDAAQRGLLWADVNGDGRPDLLVAEPASGQFSVYLQQADGQLASPKTFPTLAGVSQIVAADFNGNGKPEHFSFEPGRTRGRA